MCEKAEEIQVLRPTTANGDWYMMRIDPCSPDDMVYGFYAEDTVECRVGGMMLHKNSTWLPRQDQLQEMLNNVGWHQYDEPGWNLHFINKKMSCEPDLPDDGGPSAYYGSFTSFEQLWLAFVMKEKYNKAWNGEEWI